MLPTANKIWCQLRWFDFGWFENTPKLTLFYFPSISCKLSIWKTYKNPFSFNYYILLFIRKSFEHNWISLKKTGHPLIFFSISFENNRADKLLFTIFYISKMSVYTSCFRSCGKFITGWLFIVIVKILHAHILLLIFFVIYVLFDDYDCLTWGSSSFCYFTSKMATIKCKNYAFSRSCKRIILALQ